MKNPIELCKEINWRDRKIPPNPYGKSLNEEFEELDNKYIPIKKFDLYYWLFIGKVEIVEI